MPILIDMFINIKGMQYYFQIIYSCSKLTHENYIYLRCEYYILRHFLEVTCK